MSRGRERKEKTKGIVASGKGLKSISPLDLPWWCPFWVVEQLREKRQKEKGNA